MAIILGRNITFGWYLQRGVSIKPTSNLNYSENFINIDKAVLPRKCHFCEKSRIQTAAIKNEGSKEFENLGF